MNNKCPKKRKKHQVHHQMMCQMPKKTKNENVVSCINVLIQSSVKGQKAGAYTLEEASTIMEAVKFLQNNFGKGPAAPTV